MAGFDSASAAYEEMPLASPPPHAYSSPSKLEYNGNQVVIVGTVGLILVTGALLARLYAKAFLFKKMEWDDYVYFISWPCGVALIALEIAIVKGGVYGHHAWDVQIRDMTKPIILRCYILTVMLGPFQWMAKLTLFAFIANTFASLRYMKVLAYLGILVSGMIYVGGSMTLGMTCGPQGGTDRLAYLAGQASQACDLTSDHVSVLTAAMSVIIDFYILALPLPAIFKLRLPLKKMIAVSLIFLVGLGACVSSIVSLYFRAKDFNTSDITWVLSPIFLTFIIDITVGLLIPCTASFAKIYRKFRPNMAMTALPATSRIGRSIENFKRKGRPTGKDEMVLYSTTATAGWKGSNNSSSHVSEPSCQSVDGFGGPVRTTDPEMADNRI